MRVTDGGSNPKGQSVGAAPIVGGSPTRRVRRCQFLAARSIVGAAIRPLKRLTAEAKLRFNEASKASASRLLFAGFELALVDREVLEKLEQDRLETAIADEGEGRAE